MKGGIIAAEAAETCPQHKEVFRGFPLSVRRGRPPL